MTESMTTSLGYTETPKREREEGRGEKMDNKVELPSVAWRHMFAVPAFIGQR